MKIKLNSEDLRMVVLKQIVSNASMGMLIDRKIGIIESLIPFTPRKQKLKILRVRGDRLQLFETALSKNKDELIEIDFHDVDFIYEGYKPWAT